MDLNTLKEYIKIHTLSLEQDMAYVGEHEDNSSSMISYLEGSIDVSNHYLSVLEGTI